MVFSANITSKDINIHYFLIMPGMLPAHQESHDFVMLQRREQYADMLEALQVMRRIHEDTPLVHIHLKMFLIEGGCLPFDESKIVSFPFQ